MLSFIGRLRWSDLLPLARAVTDTDEDAKDIIRLMDAAKVKVTVGE